MGKGLRSFFKKEKIKLKKESGCCPFCGAFVAPQILEENRLKRDKCRCLNCNSTIYLCIAPGCNNYTKSGVVWDDWFCPSCTKYLSTSVMASIAAIAATKMQGGFSDES